MGGRLGIVGSSTGWEIEDCDWVDGIVKDDEFLQGLRASLKDWRDIGYW